MESECVGTQPGSSSDTGAEEDQERIDFAHPMWKQGVDPIDWWQIRFAGCSNFPVLDELLQGSEECFLTDIHTSGCEKYGAGAGCGGDHNESGTASDENPGVCGESEDMQNRIESEEESPVLANLEV